MRTDARGIPACNCVDVDLVMFFDEQESQAPDEEDYKLTPCGQLGAKTAVSSHKFLGEFDSNEDALAFVREDMQASNFYPSIWWVSDHGNFWQISDTGEEL